jgi:hypothetical protein
MSQQGKGTASGKGISLGAYEKPAKQKSSKPLPREIEEKRSRIHLRKDRVDNVRSIGAMRE